MYWAMKLINTVLVCSPVLVPGSESIMLLYQKSSCRLCHSFMWGLTFTVRERKTLKASPETQNSSAAFHVSLGPVVVCIKISKLLNWSPLLLFFFLISFLQTTVFKKNCFLGDFHQQVCEPSGLGWGGGFRLDSNQIRAWRRCHTESEGNEDSLAGSRYFASWYRQPSASSPRDRSAWAREKCSRR